MDNQQKIINFFKTSEYFKIIYDNKQLPENILDESLRIYIDTGVNVLNEYAKLIKVWNISIFLNDNTPYSKEEHILLEKLFKGQTYWDIAKLFVKEQIKDLHDYYTHLLRLEIKAEYQLNLKNDHE